MSDLLFLFVPAIASLRSRSPRASWCGNASPLLLFLLLSIAGCGASPATEVIASKAGDTIIFTGEVVAVKDGDTIEVMRDGKAVRVRLEHIDCPEMGQPFGKAAKQFASDLAYGKVAQVEAQPRPDRYGRLIATVHVDGICLNKELVKAGLAWHFKRYSSDLEYAALEQVARQAGTGFWAEAGAVTPWDWRRTKKSRG